MAKKQKLYWDMATTFCLGLSVAASALQWQSGVPVTVQQRPYGPQREKYLLSGHIQEKFASLWSMPAKAVSETEYLELINQYLLSTFMPSARLWWNHSNPPTMWARIEVWHYMWPHYV